MEFNPQAIADLQVPVLENQELNSVYANILEKARNPIDLSTMPSDSRPDTGYYFEKSVASAVKPVLEQRNYDIDSAYTSLSDGTLIAKFDSFKSGRDNAEYFAQTQSTGEKWANGFSKFFLKTGNAVIGGTAGIVYGAGSALSEGSLSALYDNDFSNTLNDWDTKLNYQLPNYYTKQEQELGLLGQAGTANFWADKFLGGLSFTTGAIVSEGIWAYATGGTSLATSGARLGARWGLRGLGEAGTVAGLSRYKSFLKSVPGQLYTTGTISKSAALGLAKTGEVLSTTFKLARSAGYESSVEALQFKKEAEENFYSNFTSLNGRQPDETETAEFQTNLQNSANAVFGTNMAILMPSNLITMGHVLGIKSPINTGINKFIDKKVFGYGIAKTVDDAGKATYKALEATTGQKIARNLFNYAIKPGVTEGLFEEGGQGTTTKVANRWLEHTYDPKYTNQTFDSVGAFYESLGDQYGTKEGWVENGLGILIGIVGGSVNTRSEQRARTRELEYESAVATQFQGDYMQSLILPSRVQTANRIAGFSEEAREEEQKGNVVKSALAQKSALLAFINAKQVLGEDISDTVSELQASMESITEDQWKSAGVEASEIEQYKKDSLGEFQTLAQQWKTNKSYWQYMLGNNIAGLNTLDTTAIEDVLGSSFNKNAQIVEALAWQSTIGENAHTQMKEAQEVIARELGAEYATALNTTSLLKAQTANRRGQITKATKQYKILEQQRDKLVKDIARLNSAPRNPIEGQQKEKGLQSAEKNIALLDINEKIAGLRAEIDNFAQEISKTENYSKEVGTLDFGTQDLLNSAITGDDLLSLEENSRKFESLLASFYDTNRQRGQYLADILKEYSDSQEIFMQHQATQQVILSKDFKIENLNSWLGRKIGRNKEMDKNTKEWFQDAIRAYSNAKVETVGETQAEDIIAEPINTDVQEQVPNNPDQAILAQISLLEAEREQRLSETTITEAPAQETTVTRTAITSTDQLSVGQGIETLTDRGTVTAIEGNLVTIQLEGKGVLTVDPRYAEIFAEATEQDKTDAIRETLDNIAEGVSGAGDRMIQTYAERIRNGESRESVIQGLPESFIQAIDLELSDTDAINTEYDRRIEELKLQLSRPIPRTNLEIYRERIRNLLKRGYSHLNYIGDNYDGIANKKPTSAEIEEFRREPRNTKRYKELRQKLQDWKLLDSAVDEEYNSIAELVELIQQLETQVEAQDTLDEITPQEAVFISDEIGASSDVVDYDLLQNVLGNVTVKKVANTNNLRFSHIKMSTITGRLNLPFTVKLRGKELSKFDLANLEIGTSVTIADTDFTIGSGGTIEVDAQKFASLSQALNLYVVADPSSNWTYSSVYEVKGTDFVKKNSDFTEDIDTEALYEVKPGDTIRFEIGNEDGYNATLKGDNVKKQLKIYAVDSQGRRLSLLKSAREGAVQENFLRLRERAYKMYLENPQAQKIDLGVTAKAKNLYLGSPELYIQDGQIQNLDFTPQAVSQVLATGYIEDGNITSSREFPQGIDTTFLAKISRRNAGKKIPFVVFKKGSYNVAYPVTMKKTPSPMAFLFDGIIGSSQTPQEKITALNNAIQDNGIQVEKLAFADIQNQELLASVRTAFESKQVFVTAQDFASPLYEKGRLVQDAQINIDLENIQQAVSDAKLRVSLGDDIVFSTEREARDNTMSELEDRLSELAIQMDRLQLQPNAYVDSKGNAIENAFTDYLADNPTETPKNNLDKLRNIRILSEAFKLAPKKFRDLMGAETVQEIQGLLVQYDFIKSQAIITPQDKNSGENNTEC